MFNIAPNVQASSSFVQITLASCSLLYFSRNLSNCLEEKYGLISQVNRAAVSISSNISEGSSRRSQKDYYRFIEIALGSCFELESQLLIALELEFCDKEKIKSILQEIDEEQKMLISFMKKLQN